MRSIKKCILYFLCVFLFSGCSSNNHSLSVGEMDDNPKSNKNFWYEFQENKDEEEMFDDTELNFVGADLREYDIIKYQNLLKSSKFNSQTKWPADLPDFFNPERIMGKAMNPGLGINKIHSMGITGKDIGIAIIDTPPLINHNEYESNIKLFHRKKNSRVDYKYATLHGSAVTSIAAGKNVGIAPSADIYFIADDFISTTSSTEEIIQSLVEDIEDLIELNKTLDDDKKIRIVAITYGTPKEAKNYKLWKETLKKAKANHLFILDIMTYYEYFDSGLRCEIDKDPDDINSYIPISFRNEYNTIIEKPVIPIQGKCYASTTGKKDYTYDALGGTSWGIPYLCGLYALAYQVDSGITFDEFYQILVDTAIEYNVEYDYKLFNFQKVIQPFELINQIEKRK